MVSILIRPETFVPRAYMPDLDTSIKQAMGRHKPVTGNPVPQGGFLISLKVVPDDFYGVRSNDETVPGTIDGGAGVTL